MKIASVKIENFRGYKNEVEIPFDNLTVLVGKNDVGKSTVLEALDIFFNEKNAVAKAEKDDICKLSDADSFKVSVVFDDLPAEVIIDDTNKTTLKDEYLLNKDNKLEIIKQFPKGNISIYAYHPTNPKCSDLLLKKQKGLRDIVDKEKIDCNKNFNSEMRKAIWKSCADDIQLQMVEIDASKEDAKNIYDKLQPYMPLYSLFQADRKNSDGDSEVQDPLKEAVKQIINDDDIQKKLSEVAEKVQEQLNVVSKGTLEKLKEMDSSVAESLNPKIPSIKELKWSDVFKSVSIAGDNDIPINKRGSGVKRLILINFFRAEAERKALEKCNKSIIYAIEEPETSQHNENQKILADAFKRLAEVMGVQVILTTHSSYFVKQLQAENLRLIYGKENNEKEVLKVQSGVLGYPSLNEINYEAFGDFSTEYHDELYAYLQEDKVNRWDKYTATQMTRPYIQIKKNGQKENKQITTTEYVRHQIHHPENRENPPYTPEELRQSILEMRKFIENLPK